MGKTVDEMDLENFFGNYLEAEETDFTF